MAENRKIRVVVDAMGGDFAPDVNLTGSIEALKSRPDLEITLVGIQSILEEKLHGISSELRARLQLVHAEEVISMEDHAGKAVRQKKNSSLIVGLKEIKSGNADAFVSAGNSGAVMAGALLTLGRISDVERPAIIIKLPTVEGYSILLDVGANVDCRSSHLVQFAEMGRVYAESVEGVSNPKVGLLSNASESHKGNEITRETDAQLRGNPRLNYIGYVEGTDVFKGTADVVVCDGFVGNIVLKTAEGLVSTVREWFKRELKSDLFGWAGVLLLKRLLSKFKSKFDYEPYGAAPLLGINGLVLISHGASSSAAICNGILTAARAVELSFISKITQQMEADGKPKEGLVGQESGG